MGCDQDLRRTSRTPTAWAARYALDDRPEDGWCACRVIDVSLGGAALEIFGSAPLPDAGMRVELHVTTDPSGLQLHAQTRNIGPSNNSGVRVGVEWSELSPLESELLGVLFALVLLPVETLPAGDVTHGPRWR